MLVTRPSGNPARSTWAMWKNDRSRWRVASQSGTRSIGATIGVNRRTVNQDVEKQVRSQPRVG